MLRNMAKVEKFMNERSLTWTWSLFIRWEDIFDNFLAELKSYRDCVLISSEMLRKILEKKAWKLKIRKLTYICK